MKKAFINLHKTGYAHSVECWHNKKLVGGLYGIAMGKIFFGESMFSQMPNTSKITLVHLAKRLEEMDFQLIDCQINSKHLQTLGAQLITRNQFAKFLKDFCNFKKILLH
jgi:leucyl/phenylalanyl-tRNA--protein transferase